MRVGVVLGTCIVCGKKAPTISSTLRVCLDCLRREPKALEIAREAHARWRQEHGFAPNPPRSPSGVRCRLCVNECSVGVGGSGFCGVWRNVGRRLQRRGLLAYWYLDPHPTNCVAAPVCPANTSQGYPRYTKAIGIERGYYNLAVFMLGCSLDCLFCQNWEHKTLLVEGPPPKYVRSVDELVEAAMDPLVTCVCYFGGDPTPHAPDLILASKKILEEAGKRGVVKRICWETNGLANPVVFREMARLSLESGGIVKIDWKAWTPQVYEALTGVDGFRAVERLKENAKIAVELWHESGRRRPPLLVVSILLVPGYVDAYEVEQIASYLAELDKDIPLMLLAFHPEHRMRDLPTTSWRHALEAARVARKAGLKHVFIGNSWLLSNAY